MYNQTSDLGLISVDTLLEKAAHGTDALLVLSGGLDSAYLLWRYAQVVKDRPIHVHFIELYPSFSPRNRVEDMALIKQIEYIDRDVSVTRSILDTTAKVSLLRDVSLGLMLSGEIAMQKGCEYIAAGDDLPTALHRGLPNSVEDPREAAMFKAVSGFIRAETKGVVDIVFSFETHKLQKAYEEMPDDYMGLAVSCRRPIIDNGRVTSCGSCHSCEKNKLFGFFNRVSKGLVLPSTPQ